jgi:RNA polymerase subunit RPABC4/transcription elongation factor Spt4
MTNSATSTDRREADPRASFQPWHFFLLLAMAGATAAVMVSRETHPAALLLLSAAVICSGLVAIALTRTVSGFFNRTTAPALPVTARQQLEREKALVLRSLKELEFDRAMGKVSEADYSDISQRLRARAIVLMQDIDRAVETPLPAQPPSRVPACAKCGTVNDKDARFCKNCGSGIVASVVALGLAVLLIAPATAVAQTAMPNFKEMSGSVLPTTEIPVGTVSARLLRGGPDKPLSKHEVEFLVDGKSRRVTTDEVGRAQVSGLPRGARVRAVAVVEGERLESQEAVVENSGLRILLVATDPDAMKRAAEDKELASAAAVKGIVVLGPESRIIAEMSNDRLNIYYILQIINSARTPVDIGGPLVFDLPREARSSVVLEGSSPKATANGPRITVTGPFAPGVTAVQAAYELPYSGAVARVDQRWPAALQQVTILVQQIGGLSVSSPQVAAKRDVNDQGQALILATGPGLAAGQSMTIEISGLPHHATWPRTLALSLAGLIAAAGIWGAVTANPRRRIA